MISLLSSSFVFHKILETGLDLLQFSFKGRSLPFQEFGLRFLVHRSCSVSRPTSLGCRPYWLSTPFQERLPCGFVPILPPETSSATAPEVSTAAKKALTPSWISVTRRRITSAVTACPTSSWTHALRSRSVSSWHDAYLLSTSATVRPHRQALSVCLPQAP